ncbi:PssE/Cps14G family polysaccharide biosynthesis glycosyltransferase [Niallia sp. FSL W8-0635]|uniref:PssE/Cps14G family polysaccharide biosynthesis glycosyltransferase n=1 Tax=Niallia sp. FSL W8-0635 TaxID=2975337 RepID=UPI0030F61106
MIFVTVGSQKFQFNRLLIEIDKLIEKNVIQPDDVFAQSGHSNYQPKLYKYKQFLNNDEFVKMVKNCNVLLTHGGTGAIINGVKSKKKVIAVPRLAEYGEHVDNHQFDIVEQFEKSNLIYGLKEIEYLEKALNEIKYINFNDYKSNTNNIINLIQEFIERL